jgi:hypothetical protein
MLRSQHSSSSNKVATTTPESKLSNRFVPTQSVNSEIMQLQRTIGNRAVIQMMKSRSENQQKTVQNISNSGGNSDTIQRQILGVSSLSNNNVATSQTTVRNVTEEACTIQGSATAYTVHFHANNYSQVRAPRRNLTSLTATFTSTAAAGTKYHTTIVEGAGGAWATSHNQGPNATARADMLAILTARHALL